MNRKYELTDETKTLPNIAVVHRIRALRDIPRHGVKAGDLGGWIEKESNLSQDGGAWVCDNAWVYGGAKVCDNAVVYGGAKVCDNAVAYGGAKVYGGAAVYGDAKVYGYAGVGANALICGDAEVSSSMDYVVFKNTWSSGRYFTYTRSNGMWKVGCFYGTGEELIKKAYADGELSGKCYEAIVRAQEAIDKATKEAGK